MQQASETVRILGVAGSLRAGSYNRQLLRAAIELSPADVEVSAWDGLKAIPPFDEDDEHTPAPSVAELREAIAGSDAVLVVTPEYNGSLPGQLKNALDWASRPRRETVLRNKLAAVVGASPSPGGARSAQADARRVLSRAGAQVLDLELAVAHVHQHVGHQGALTDPRLREDLGALVASLARTAAQLNRADGRYRQPVAA